MRVTLCPHHKASPPEITHPCICCEIADLQRRINQQDHLHTRMMGWIRNSENARDLTVEQYRRAFLGTFNQAT